MLKQKSIGSVFANVKSRLGLGGNQSDYDDAYDDAGYDDYDGAGDYGVYGDYGDDYAEYAEYADAAVGTNSREGGAAYAARTASRGAQASSRSGSSYRSSFPRLVSIDDVRANVQNSDRVSDDSDRSGADRYSSASDRYSIDRYGSSNRYSANRYTSSSGRYSGADALFRSSSDEASSRDSYSDSYADSESYADSYSSSKASSSYRSRSFGAPRLIERAADYMRSTATSDLPPDDFYQSSAQGSFLSSGTGASDAAEFSDGTARYDSSDSEAGYDPYEAYSGFGATSHVPRRAVVVLQPRSYADAERISKTVKAGDAAVLVLRATPDSLAKRILDFAFGVSSALGASVDCVADKIFVIATGSALSDEEIAQLRRDGVLS